MNPTHIAEKPKKRKKNFNSCVFCLKTISGNNVSLHQFPKDPIRRKIWLKNCGFVEEDIKNKRKLCSSHFDESCFIKKRHRRILSKSAIPLIFEDEKKKKRKRKDRRQDSLLPKPVDSAVTNSNCVLTFMPKLRIILVEPSFENPVLAAPIQDTQTDILQMQIDELDSAMWDISQSFPELSEIMPQMQFGDLGSSVWEMGQPFPEFSEK